MRIHVTSVSRARKLAKALRAILAERHDVLVGHVEAQAALARLLGYRDWSELLKVKLQARGAASPFDHEIGDAMQARIDWQAASLMSSFPLDEESSYRLAGYLRASASPVPVLVGLSRLEHRGVTPNGAAMMFSADGFRVIRSTLTPREVEQILANTNVKIFLKVPPPAPPNQTSIGSPR